MISYEVNFDGLVGPTHNYGGLSYGNIASMGSGLSPSNPKAAALEGVQKMKFLHDLGIRQAVLPPHERPYLPTLRTLGFTGPDRNLPERAYKEIPEIFPHLCSSSFMWAANVATITPSIDCGDHHVHITPANLISHFHRTIEAEDTAEILKKIFPDSLYYTHNHPLPRGHFFRDEGAANITRFCRSYSESGIYLFVYGEAVTDREGIKPSRYPPRQTLEASQAVIRQHGLFADRVVFAQQHPSAIDGGAFHNDVVSAGNRNFFFYHERAFADKADVIDQLQDKAAEFCDTEIHSFEVMEEEIPLELAVRTYLFNSQILSLEDESMALIAPVECRDNEKVNNYLQKLLKDPKTPIRDIHFVDLTQSMRNGGGPACLRIRAVLNENEYNAVLPNVILDNRLFGKLTDWVEKHYREKITIKDLRDPALIDESQTALDELTKILNLGSIYSFQRQP